MSVLKYDYGERKLLKLPYHVPASLVAGNFGMFFTIILEIIFISSILKVVGDENLCLQA